MKCYKLNATALAKLKNNLEGMTFVVALLLFLIGIVVYPLVIIGIEDSIVMACIGILSWTTLLSIISISFKRWTMANIEEC